MAFGFTPKYMEQISLDGLTPQQFLALCIETIERMQWSLDYKSNAGIVAHTGKGMFSSNFKLTVIIDEGIISVQSESTGSELFDMGRNKKTVLVFIGSLESLKSLLPPGVLQERYKALADGLPAPENDFLINPDLAKSKGGVFALLVPRQGYFITPIIIDINIAVFICMVISGAGFMQPDSSSIIAWGANFTPLTLGGQWWRLITNTFEHIGIMHLLFNMYALIYVGLLLEPILGREKFALAYLLTGILASLTSLWWHDITLSAGASGAIFGMYGVFLAMLTTNFIEKSKRKPLLTSIAVFVGLNLVYGMKGGIDNSAHVGGLISGLLIGYIFYPALRRPAEAKFNYGILAVVAVLFVSASAFIYKKLPNDMAIYQEKMSSFSDHEKAALAYFKMPYGSTHEDSLNALTKTGIDNWNTNKQLMIDVKKLHIPARLKDQADILVTYCDDRLAGYRLMYKGVSENSTEYNDSIIYSNYQVREVLDKLEKTVPAK